jgi:hypothetical protein
MANRGGVITHTGLAYISGGALQLKHSISIGGNVTLIIRCDPHIEKAREIIQHVLDEMDKS